MDSICFDMLVKDHKRAGGLIDREFYLLRNRSVCFCLFWPAHNKKKLIIQFYFLRSGETISKYFREVLNDVLRLQKQLLVKLKPVNPDYGPER